MHPLAQATADSTPALLSIAGILTATWVIVALLKRLVGFSGKTTLIVSLCVSVALTLVALFVTRTLAADPLAAILAVLTGVAGAAGVDASGKALLNNTPKALLLGLVTLGALASGGCSTMTPGQRYAVTSNAFAGTVQEIAVLVRAGVVPDEALPGIAGVAHEIDFELDALDDALRNDTPLDFPFVLARVERLLGRLAQYQLDAEGAKYATTHTRPVDRPGQRGGPPLRGDPRHRAAGQDRGPRPDTAGAGPGQEQTQGGAQEPGRRDRLAAELDALGRRHARLTQRIARHP